MEAMLKESPGIGNISELSKDETSTVSSLLLNNNTMRHSNISRDVIAEVEEEELDSKGNNISEVKEIALQLFKHQYSEVPISKYTSVLGGASSKSKSICNEYLNLFTPLPKSLVMALRKLCSKLFLMGESTAIDQILEIFSKKWIESNTNELLGDYQTVHIISFALLILNTDLNNYKIDNRNELMSKNDFVDNILTALKEDDTIKPGSNSYIQPQLQNFYDSICAQPLELLKLPSKSIETQRKKPLSILRTFSTSSNMSGYLKSPSSSNASYTNISLQSQKHTRRLSSFGSSLSLNREAMNLTESSDANYDVEYLKDKHDDKLEKLGPPWLVEGILKTEVDNSSSNTKSPKLKNNSSMRVSWFARLTHTSIISSDLDIYKTKGWKQSIVIIRKGLLKQFSFGSISDRRNFLKTRSTKYVDTMVTYNLYSATATLIDNTNQIISNSTQKTDGYAWVLTIPNLLSSNSFNGQEKKVVYYAPTLEIANNFIETCNFWAARITSIPSTEDEIVTNVEYGWSDKILTMNEGFEDVKLTHWESLISIESSFIPSSFTTSNQFDNLKIYVEYLANEIVHHNELKPVLERVWGKDEKLNESFQIVMDNWGERYAYLLKQHEKFKIYLDSLALALAFKASKV